MKPEDTLNSSIKYDPMKDWRQAEVRLSFKPPCSHDWKTVAFPISEFVSECMAKLPRDRELPFALESQHQTLRMEEQRYIIASSLGMQMADALLKAIGSLDTINGYEPEDWRRMHEPPPARAPICIPPVPRPHWVNKAPSEGG